MAQAFKARLTTTTTNTRVTRSLPTFLPSPQLQRSYQVYMDKKKISCFLNVLSVQFIIHVMFYCSFAGVIAMQCLGNGDSNVESLAAIRRTLVCFTSVAHPTVYRELFPSPLREENIRFQTDWIFCSGHIDNNCPSLNLNCI